jgi:hypothetical protein
MPRQSKATATESCPNCGYCQHCGRAPQRISVAPAPYYPWWCQGTLTYPFIWYDTTVGGAATTSAADIPAATSTVGWTVTAGSGLSPT